MGRSENRKQDYFFLGLSMNGCKMIWSHFVCVFLDRLDWQFTIGLIQHTRFTKLIWSILSNFWFSSRVDCVDQLTVSRIGWLWLRVVLNKQDSDSVDQLTVDCMDWSRSIWTCPSNQLWSIVMTDSQWIKTTSSVMNDLHHQISFTNVNVLMTLPFAKECYVTLHHSKLSNICNRLFRPTVDQLTVDWHDTIDGGSSEQQLIGLINWLSVMSTSNDPLVFFRATVDCVDQLTVICVDWACLIWSTDILQSNSWLCLSWQLI